MTNEEVLALFKELGVFKEGHFVYASKMHGRVYVNKDDLTPHVVHLQKLAEEIGNYFVGCGIETVVGPAEGSVTLAGFVALTISDTYDEDCKGIWASKEGDDFKFRPSFLKHLEGKNCVVVEDILTTGKSAAKVVEAVRQAGGTVLAVAALCNRGNVTRETLGVDKLYSVLKYPAEAWPEEECSLCKEGVPVNTDLGHGKAFLDRKAVELKEAIAAVAPAPNAEDDSHRAEGPSYGERSPKITTDMQSLLEQGHG